MTDSQVRKQVSRYLAGAISVEELERDLPDGWLLDESADGSLRDLTLRVMGHVAEFMAGDITESQLRSRLEPFAAWLLTTTYTATGIDIVGANRARTEVFVAGTARLEVPA